MDFVISLIIWAALILLAVYFAQLIIGLVIWIVIGVAWLVTFPFAWGYRKLKKEN